MILRMLVILMIIIAVMRCDMLHRKAPFIYLVLAKYKQS